MLKHTQNNTYGYGYDHNLDNYQRYSQRLRQARPAGNVSRQNDKKRRAFCKKLKPYQGAYQVISHHKTVKSGDKDQRSARPEHPEQLRHIANHLFCRLDINHRPQSLNKLTTPKAPASKITICPSISR
jgi:hypothetical protein